MPKGSLHFRDTLRPTRVPPPAAFALSLGPRRASRRLERPRGARPAPAARALETGGEVKWMLRMKYAREPRA